MEKKNGEDEPCARVVNREISLERAERALSIKQERGFGFFVEFRRGVIGNGKHQRVGLGILRRNRGRKPRVRGVWEKKQPAKR